MNTTTTRTITPADRFAFIGAHQAQKAGSLADRAMREASYWESFPHSYTAEQVAAAQALIAAVAAGGDYAAEAALVLELAR